MTTAERKVLLLPGFMLDETLWEELLPLLPPRWNVEPLLLPRGESVFEVADKIAQRHTGPHIVLGFSMGGYVARALASRHPDLVSGLILVATSARTGPSPARPSLTTARPTSIFKGLSRAAVQRSFGIAHQNDEALIARVQAMSIRLGQDAFKWQSSLERSGIQDDKIRCPTLVIAAAQDQLRSAVEAEELAGHIAGARLCLIEDSGHLLPIESPEALATHIERWALSQYL